MHKARIVLDLDETLLTSRHDYNANEARARGLDNFTTTDGTLIVVRPGFSSFLREINRQFDEIYIYTAAVRDYAAPIVESMFNGTQIHNCWTRNDCHFTETDVFKNLTDKRSPEGDILDGVHTMMIDDRHTVTGMNVYTRGGNHIVIPPFMGDPNDRHLVKVISEIISWKSRFMK
jgi:TFIIF-interacting CTD phosphatase-like protein